MMTMLFDNTLKEFVRLAGLCFGLGTYFAPSYTVGPNGIFPLYLKTTTTTSWDDDDGASTQLLLLDPISTFYIRLHGMHVLFFLLAYMLFVERGGTQQQKRSYTKIMLLGNLAFLLTVPPRIHASPNFEEFYVKQNWHILCVISLITILWLGSIIVRNPIPPTAPKFKQTRFDKVGFILQAVYAGYFAYQNVAYGPIHAYWNMDKLAHNNNNDFHLVMKETSYSMGSSMVPLVWFLVTDAWKFPPTYTWKLLCLYMTLCIPIIYKQTQDYESGYSIQKTFVSDLIADTSLLVVGLYRLYFGGALFNNNNKSGYSTTTIRAVLFTITTTTTKALRKLLPKKNEGEKSTQNDNK